MFEFEKKKLCLPFFMIIVVSNAVVAHMYFYDTKVRQVAVIAKTFKCSKAAARCLRQLSSTKIKIY